MSRTLFRQGMINAFRQKSKPTMFLSSFFMTPPANIKKSQSVDIDIQRNGRKIAVNVAPGRGGRYNKNKSFTNKQYTPPEYNEFTTLNPDEMLLRSFGQTQDGDIEYAQHAIAKITDDMVELQNVILRTIEKQAADALLNGKIVLINGDEIDFSKKATHDYDVVASGGGAWTGSSSTALEDIATACQLITVDGQLNTGVIDMIVAEDVIEVLLANPQFKERAQFDSGNVKRTDIVIPEGVNTEGAVFHGVFSAGSYRVNLWSYPSYYEIPTGFNLANEGTTVPYIPSGEAILIGRGARFDKVYAGIPVLTNQVDSEVATFFGGYAPQVVAADFMPYLYPDTKRQSIIYGVRSKPLCIPTQIDGFVSITKIKG